MGKSMNNRYKPSRQMVRKPAAPVPGEPDRSPFVPSIDKRVVRFEELSELEKKEGPHPANVWVYGRFTARTAVSGGVFLSSVNEGINFPDWEENLSVIDNPGDFLMRRVVFRTKSPLPEIRKGTKFTVPKARPARLVEVVRVDGLIARMVLEDGVTIEAVPLYKFLLELENGKYGTAY